MKKAILIIVLLIIITAGVYLIFFRSPQKSGEPEINLTPAVNETQSMKIETIKEGTDEAAKNGDTVLVNYVGTLEDGTKFDSSIDRGTPFSFKLGVGQVIQGWDLGVLGMKVGEKRRLTIPSDLAYGDAGAGSMIPPGATLIFEVDLLGINQ